MSTRTSRVSVELFLAATLLALAAGLRFWRLDLGWFGVDQARDVQTALDIAAGRDWPTVGPTMRRVTSLGALYYYFWALPYLVSRDPLAGYRFAAGLGLATVALTGWLARRWWGTRPGLVALAVMATARVAVIDGRVAWAPAALPFVAVVLLWLLADVTSAESRGREQGATWRFGLLGAGLGLAVQLHLAMIAWVASAVLLLVLRPPGRRALAAIALGFAALAWPAVGAVMANAGGDAGVTTLAGRGPLPDVAARLFAVLALGWRVPAAFWQWTDVGPPWAELASVATAVVEIAVLVGVVRLVGASWRGAPPARVVLLVGAVQLAMVVGLPGEAWYYYLDALLPWWALVAGAGVAPADRRAVTTPTAGWGVADVVAAVVIASAVVLGADGAAWLGAVERHGFVALDPAPLTLDGAGGRDAAAPGRLLTAGTKRAAAALVAAEPAPFATRWLATHGPAFGDATGDNGFWLWQRSDPQARPPAVTHAALWQRDDPAAPTATSAGFELVTSGPLVVARYRPRIVYEACRDSEGSVTVPMRIVPHPRRYGDGTIAHPATLPAWIACPLAAAGVGTRVVAAVSAGTVTLVAADGGSGAAGHESTLCVPARERPTELRVAIALPAGSAADLDLYERPDPSCAAEKIAR